jgi:hypothetical protein
LTSFPIAIIGAGPAGLMAAEVLAQGGAGVTAYDAMPSAGRKFLMAGRGGLNLTHSEALPEFLTRYGASMPRLAAAITVFPPDRLREWSEALGQPTFVGSSGRVFRQAFKTSPLLRAWLRRLGAMGVQFKQRHRWIGWDDDGRLSFQTPEGTVAVEPGAVVLALGGASWPRLGSDGAWVKILAAKKVTISPLAPVNCGFTVAWSDVFRDRFAGHPVKGAALSFGSQTVRGEAIITRTGIEGGAIYALSADLREAVISSGQFRAGDPPHRLASRSRNQRPGGAAVGAERQAVVFELAPQSRASVPGRRWPVAGSRDRFGRIAILAVARKSRRLDQRRAHKTRWHRADRARDLDRGWNFIRRTRRRFHDPSLALRLRRRRDAGLGSPDRRLSAAGCVRHGRGGGKRRVEVAGEANGE